VAPILDFERDANLDTPYHYKDLDAETPTIQVDGSFNPFSETDKPNKHFANFSSSYRRPEPTSNWESLYVGLKQDSEEIDTMPFENDAVTSSLFNNDEVEHTIHKTYQIHKKYIVNPIKSGMIIVDQQRAHQRILYEQFLTNITVHLASSQQLLFPLHLYFSNDEMHLISELKPSLTNTGFVFEETTVDSVVISGLPVNVSESEASIVLEQLLSDLQDGIPESSFSQNDTIAKSMARSLAVKTGTYLTEKEQENLVNGLFACKDPNVSPFQKPTFITMRVEDLDKKFAL
jgi:DNA mismatch repair protein MutL